MAKCVMKILYRTDLCCLCFEDAGENPLQLEDELGTNIKLEGTANITQILTFVLGEEFSDKTTTLTDNICKDCSISLLQCYKFMKTSRRNLERLENAVNTLSNCFEHAIDDLNGFKTLFVSINTKNLTSQQYYDNTDLDVKSIAAAIKHFQNINSRQNASQKRKSHAFSEDTFKLCDVIQEKGKSTKFKCKVCSNLFSKSFNFKKHYYSQHSPKVLKCSECPRSYGSEALLKQHKYDCHSNMMCSQCGKEYSNRYSLLYHMRQHSGEQPYECKYCGVKFQWSSRRAEHIRRYHMEPGVQCDICQMKFRALGSLYNHRKRHFNVNSRLNVTQKVNGNQESETSSY